MSNTDQVCEIDQRVVKVACWREMGVTLIARPHGWFCYHGGSGSSCCS